MTALTDKLKAEEERNRKLQKLAERFPDLHEHRDRWGTIRHSTKAVNGLVDNCIIKHNCGCCPDSPLEIWPYIEIDGWRIFADPIPYTVGEKAYGYGETEWFGWEEKLRKEGIHEKVVRIVQGFFLDNRPEEEDDD